MTKSDVQCMLTVIASFFLQGDRNKRNDLLTRSHNMVDNIERDLESLSVEGVPQTHTIEQFKERLLQSKAQADNFSALNFMLNSGDPLQTAQAVDCLRQMFEIIDCVEGTQCHELDGIADHIRRIFDLTLASTAFDFFYMVLDQEDSFEVAKIKVDILKIICLMTPGYKYFVEEQFPKFDRVQDQHLGQRLTERLGNYNFVILLQSQVKSRCVEVIDMTYLLQGSYLKNNIDISSLFQDQQSFSQIYG